MDGVHSRNLLIRTINSRVGRVKTDFVFVFVFVFMSVSRCIFCVVMFSGLLFACYLCFSSRRTLFTSASLYFLLYMTIIIVTRALRSEFSRVCGIRRPSPCCRFLSNTPIWLISSPSCIFLFDGQQYAEYYCNHSPGGCCNRIVN